MKILAMRHPPPKIAPGICYGRTDVDIETICLDNVNAIKKKLEPYSTKRIYSSPLQRCMKLANLFECQIVVDSRLAEINFGDWELRDWEQIYKTDLGKKWFQNWEFAVPPKGESLEQLNFRVKSFVSDIKNRNVEIHFIVTHAGVLRCLYAQSNLCSLKESFELIKPLYYGLYEFDF